MTDPIAAWHTEHVYFGQLLELLRRPGNLEPCRRQRRFLAANPSTALCRSCAETKALEKA